eukprot:TRINITY_DN7481_c0_g1_i2.p1 TRINITY_DN7481_c0_g1~~TRINITY_DN7481_c0_g1_i2.p1  ORF type:complete len:641 (-),score=187.63 TRINITY_DN7481_c0_g1_i2:1622-3544(-)
METPSYTYLDKIKVTVVEAEDLAKEKKNAPRNTYVQVKLQKRDLRTKVVHDSLSPKWDRDTSCFLLDVSEDEVANGLEIKFRCWDKRNKSRDNFLGEVRVPLRTLVDSNTVANQALDGWYPLAAKRRKSLMRQKSSSEALPTPASDEAPAGALGGRSPHHSGGDPLQSPPPASPALLVSEATPSGRKGLGRSDAGRDGPLHRSSLDRRPDSEPWIDEPLLSFVPLESDSLSRESSLSDAAAVYHPLDTPPKYDHSGSPLESPSPMSPGSPVAASRTQLPTVDDDLLIDLDFTPPAAVPPPVPPADVLRSARYLKMDSDKDLLKRLEKEQRREEKEQRRLERDERRQEKEARKVSGRLRLQFELIYSSVGGSEAEPKDEVEPKFQERFPSIPTHERHILSCPCSYKTKLAPGQFFVLEKHICYYAKLMRKSTKVILGCDQIKLLQKQSTNGILITDSAGVVHSFGDLDERDHVFDVLLGLVEPDVAAESALLRQPKVPDTLQVSEPRPALKPRGSVDIFEPPNLPPDHPSSAQSAAPTEGPASSAKDSKDAKDTKHKRSKSDVGHRPHHVSNMAGHLAQLSLSSAALPIGQARPHARPSTQPSQARPHIHPKHVHTPIQARLHIPSIHWQPHAHYVALPHH